VNQWCSIMRWETKMTKPFLRGREFLWQEGHTVHETKEEAEKETDWALQEYRKVSEGLLAVPVIAGRKTNSDKFAGAEFTLAIETFTPDGKAIQMGTSHLLGQNFSKPYEVRFVGRDEKWHFGWQTSWGISTRMIGSLILVHGDDKGAIVPPSVAPIQAVIVPILFKGKEEPVLKKCREVLKELSKKLRMELDERPDYTAGWKFNHWELKGVPLRIEIGPKDLENKKAVLVRRDTGEKTAVDLKDVAKKAEALLGKIQENLFATAEKRMQALKEKPRDMAGLKKAMENGKLALIPHCGKSECEAEVSEKTEGGPRIISEEKVWGNCINCGKPAAYMLYWAKSY
jgi:prolyl-tRNA synthetase